MSEATGFRFASDARFGVASRQVNLRSHRRMVWIPAGVGRSRCVTCIRWRRVVGGLSGGGQAEPSSWAAAGCTLLNVQVVRHSLAGYIERLEAFAGLTGLRTGWST
jgi:hypothetical protein